MLRLHGICHPSEIQWPSQLKGVALGRRFANSEWPDFVEEAWWVIPILCTKPINRKDVAPGSRVTHQVSALTPRGGKLRDAVVRAQEIIAEHQTKFPMHEPIAPTVQWHTTCVYDRYRLFGESRDQLWEAIAEHVETRRHKEGVADRQLMGRMAELLEP